MNNNIYFIFYLFLSTKSCLLLVFFKLKYNIHYEEDSEKNPSPRWDLNPRPSVI